MFDVSAILLAAGLSRRMGDRNKLLLPVEGQPMVRRVAQTYLSAIDGPLVVVTGFEAPRIREALSGMEVTFQHNERFADGQPGSVATGLAIAPEAHLLLIGLADQPYLTVDDLTDLIAAHRAGDADKITIPMRGGDRGNPIVVPKVLRPRLTADPSRPGCMRFTRDHPERVQEARLPSAGFYVDVDTPEHYATLAKPQAEIAT